MQQHITAQIVSLLSVQTLNNQHFNIYPNPAVTVLSIEIQEQINTKEILDLCGRIVQTETNNTNFVDVQTLPAGMYMLRLTTDKGIYQQKFVKE